MTCSTFPAFRALVGGSARSHVLKSCLRAGSILAWLVVQSAALGAVDTPAVVYPSPTNGNSNLWINPVVFWTPITETPACAGQNCTQRDVQVQIATASTFVPGEIVWENWNCNGNTIAVGCAYGGGFSIVVDSDHGDFKNALAGRAALDHDTTYYVRIRQQTRNGLAWSGYSPNGHAFTTRPAYDGAVWYVRTDGSDSGCDGRADAAYPGSGSSQPCALRTIFEAHSRAADNDVIEVRNGTYSRDDVNVTKAVKIHGESRTGTRWNQSSPIHWKAANSWLDNITMRGTNCTVNGTGNGGIQMEADQVVVTNVTLDCAAWFNTLDTAAPITGNVYRDVDVNGTGDGTETNPALNEAFVHGQYEFLGALRLDIHGWRNCLSKFSSSAGPFTYYHYEDLRCYDNYAHATELRGADYLTLIRNRNANNAMTYGEGITTPANDANPSACAQYISVEFSSSDDGISVADGVGSCTGGNFDLRYLNVVNNAVDGSGDERHEVFTSSDAGQADRITSATRYYSDYNVWYRSDGGAFALTVWDTVTYTHDQWSNYRNACNCDGNSFRTDPDFVEPQGLGTIDYDHTPRRGSPCIDSGDPAYDPRYQQAAAGITDGGGRVDIGSVEVERGSGGGGGTPPASPSNLRRVDMK